MLTTRARGTGKRFHQVTGDYAEASHPFIRIHSLGKKRKEGAVPMAGLEPARAV